MRSRKSVGFAVYESVRLPIYYRPVKVKLRGSPEGANGEERLASGPAFKLYDSFQIAFHESGRWRTAKRLAENGSDVPELSHAERRIYFAAKTILQPHKLEVDAAARLLAELLGRLDGTSLQQAVDFFIAHGRGMISGATMGQVYTAYLVHLHQRGVGQHHLRDVEHPLPVKHEGENDRDRIHAALGMSVAIPAKLTSNAGM
jgi:hypothetical protein